MRRALKTIQILVLAIASLAYLGLKCHGSLKGAEAQDDLYYVERVVDGDTIKLSNGEKVRLIGVDTPESHYSSKLLRDARTSHQEIKTIQGLGKIATSFTKTLCLGKTVRLEFDVDKKDRYGRLLAYVYLYDGTFVNARILEEGYGQVMTIPPNVKHADYFLKLQRDARINKRGLWKDGP